MLKGRNLGGGGYRHMLLHADLGYRTWHCGLGNVHPLSRLLAAARSRVFLNPGNFRSVAKKKTK